MPVHDWTRVSAGIFHDFHLEWISALKRRLNSGLLPAGYYALAEQIAGGREPDVLALEDTRTPKGNGNGSQATGGGGGGIALATAPPKVRFTAEAEVERYATKRRRIAIRHSSNDRVVALVEIMSPGNKDRPAALADFVEKAVGFLDGGIHLLVIDLFPPSVTDPNGIHQAIWSRITQSDFHLPPGEPFTLASYSAGAIKRCYVEPVGIGKTLPDMPLFVDAETYVPVPLEATYDAAFGAVPERWREELG